ILSSPSKNSLLALHSILLYPGTPESRPVNQSVPIYKCMFKFITEVSILGTIVKKKARCLQDSATVLQGYQEEAEVGCRAVLRKEKAVQKEKKHIRRCENVTIRVTRTTSIHSGNELHNLLRMLFLAGDMAHQLRAALSALAEESYNANSTGTKTDNKSDLMKLKSFCKAKDTVNKTKRQPTEWEKIFNNPTSDRGLISNVYKELKKLDISKPNNPN
ncbi:hypothetical protein STEG23_033678, partial [Scotinomys teguina]